MSDGPLLRFAWNLVGTCQSEYISHCPLAVFMCFLGWFNRRRISAPTLHPRSTLELHDLYQALRCCPQALTPLAALAATCRGQERHLPSRPAHTTDMVDSEKRMVHRNHDFPRLPRRSAKSRWKHATALMLTCITPLVEKNILLQVKLRM